MKKFFPAYLRVPIIFFAFFGLLEYLIDSGNMPAFIKYPMVSVFLGVFLFILIAIEITLSAMNNIDYHLMTDEERKAHDEAEELGFADSSLYKYIMKKVVRAHTKEEESELLLHHDYDGIHELDNNLPTWWVWTFYITITFSVIYLARFEVFGGDNQEMELQKEIAQAKIDIEKYKLTAPDIVDENSVKLLTEAADLDAGKAIFQTNCVACHRADAGGQVGPNLTDDRWINGGGIKNVFHTIANGGRDGKGMIAWKGTLKPSEIQKVASYVLSLQGSNPKDPKAPEGDVWVEK